MLTKFNLKKHSTLLSLIAKLVDVMLYLAAALIACYQQFNGLNLTTFYQIALLLSAVLMIPIFTFFSVYESLRGRSFGVYFQTLIPAFATLILILAAAAFITKTGEYFSRQWFLMWHVYAFVLLIIFRINLRQLLKYMRRRGFNHKRIVIIGLNDLTCELVRRLNSAFWIGFDVDAVLTNKIYKKHHIDFAKVKIKKIPKDLAKYMEENNIDEVWVASIEEESKLQEISKNLRQNIVTIRYFPAIFGLELLNHSITEVLGLPAVDLISSPMTGVNRVVKVIEDKILASLILTLVSPLFLIAALLVKLSSAGPIFYKQKRHGWDGKPINIYKFRTMFTHDEPKGIITQASLHDPRITKIGKILRRTSIDELPQFANVLKGEMSIVGPRPHAIEHNKHYKHLISSYMQRHLVKPGLTGWAQVNGWRGETSTLEKMEKRIEYDLYYINHWSFWFDLKIIFLTILRIFRDENAY